MTFTYKRYTNGKTVINLGCTKVGQIHLTDLNEPAAYVSGLEVKESFRNKGIGSMALNRACEHAKVAGRSAISLYVTVQNVDAQRFYKRNGFFIAVTTDGKKNKCYLMVKQI